jgi:hypothetical protein
MIVEKIKKTLDQNFLRSLVLIDDFTFNGNILIMAVTCVEDKGRKDTSYKLEFKSVNSFELWRNNILERGYEVDVDDISLHYEEKENSICKIEFNCSGFSLKFTFSDVELQLLK